MVTSHIVSPELHGTRLDHVLRRLFPHTSRRVLLLWLAQGAVRVDGRVGRKGHLVIAGQAVTVEEVDVASDGNNAPDTTPFELSILFENADVVVVDKPAGQASTSLEGGARYSVAALLLERYPNMATLGHGRQDAGLIHRLDTGTSGVLVAAKSPKAFSALTHALHNGELGKVYWAWTRGSLPNQRGTIALPLRGDPKNRRRVIPATGRHEGTHRVHVTHYEVLATHEGITLVRLLAPVATRHQIRAHLASVGCPLLADELYGGALHSGVTRHALHALQVSYRGAVACGPFDCTAPPPDDVRTLVPFVLPT